MIRFAIPLCAAVCAAAVLPAAADMRAEAERFSQMYFAPMDGGNFWRLYDPQSGMVEFMRRGNGTFRGAAGWNGAPADGGRVVLSPPEGGIEFRFKDGKPESLSVDGKSARMEFDGEDMVLSGGIAPMWDGAEEDALEFHARKWPDRWTFLYANPNHAAMLFAFLAIVWLWAFLRSGRVWIVLSGAAGAAASCWCLVKTGGRAGFVAFAFGAAAVFLFRLFRKGAKWRLGLLAAVAAAAAAAFFAGGNFGRISAKANDRGSVWRRTIWREVPRMMADSPRGWHSSSGRAYMDWYQPLDSDFVAPSLTSDHLTYMVKMGWTGRFLWAFAWFGVLAVLARFAARRGESLPFALFLAFGTAAAFNPLLHVKTLWILPVASFATLLPARPWRHARQRIPVPAAIAAAAALALTLSFYFTGRNDSGNAKFRVRTDGRRVFAGSASPRVWIVDDRYTLGWLFAPKELRNFCAHFPQTQSFGYVEELAFAPQRVRRLVLAGRKCRDYIEAWNAGKAPKADELVFISPSLPLDAVPENLRRSCRFRMVVGEFAARYADVYGPLEPSPEIAVAVGAEVYIPGWTGLALGR